MNDEEAKTLRTLEQGLRGLVVAGAVTPQVRAWAEPLFVTLDALRAPASLGNAQRFGTANVFTTTAERRAVLEWSLAECARVARLPARVDPALYWAVAAPGVKLSAAELKEKSWCGGYALCAVKSAGFGTSTRWDFFGRGMGSSVFVTRTPQPADIAYFDKPNQHYAMIEALSDDMLWLINGNSAGKGLSRNVVKRSGVVCYSIERMLQDAAHKLGDAK